MDQSGNFKASGQTQPTTLEPGIPTARGSVDASTVTDSGTETMQRRAPSPGALPLSSNPTPKKTFTNLPTGFYFTQSPDDAIPDPLTDPLLRTALTRSIRSITVLCCVQLIALGVVQPVQARAVVLE